MKSAELNLEKSLIKKMYDAVYSDKARRIGKMIRDEVFGKRENIGQNCILAKRDIEKLFALANVKKEAKILDLCCGDGGVSLYLAKKYKVYLSGVDFSDIGIAVAKESSGKKNLNANCDFRACDAEDLPFKDGVFDVIYSLDSFIHVKDKERVLKECFRLLKPQGRLLFYDWLDMDGVDASVQQSGELWGHIYVAENQEYLAILENSGFDILEFHDNSKNFTRIIAKWEGINLSYKEFLIKECGLDYFNKAKRRWALARELTQANILGQGLFICQKQNLFKKDI